MKWLIGFVIGLMFVAGVQAACADHVYKINLVYDGTVHANNIEKITGCYPSTESPGYSYTLLSDTGESLYTFQFGDPSKIYVDTSLEGMAGGVIAPEDSDFTLIIPVIKDAKDVVIYNEDQEKVGEINLPEFNMKTFAPGQEIKITFFPSAQGVYEEAYFYSSGLEDMFRLDCEYMCYRDIITYYKIPASWETGEHRIMLYDYSKNKWRSISFLIGYEATDSELIVDFR